MSFCVLGQVAGGAVTVAGCENIDTSYPGFVDDLCSVGGSVGGRFAAAHESGNDRPQSGLPQEFRQRVPGAD
jgi:hypothetical protein